MGEPACGPGVCLLVEWTRIEAEDGMAAPLRVEAVLALRVATGDWLFEEFVALGSVRQGWVARQLERIDFAPDLKQGVGEARWWRGLAVMLVLVLAALGLRPGLSPVQAAPAMRADAAAMEEFRSQMIMPLANGGEAGRHMGPTRLAVAVAGVAERSRVELVATLGVADSFGRMLQRAGVAAGDISRASELVAGAVPLPAIAPGTRVELVLGSGEIGAGRPLEGLAMRPRFDLDLRLRSGPDGLVLERHALAVDTTPLRIKGTAGASLYRSARAAGAPVRALQQYLQVLDAHSGLDGVQPGDGFDMILSYRRSAGGSVEAGDLLYAGLERDGSPLGRWMRWGNGGQFLDANGQQQATTSLMMPVAGHVTSNFGMRFHPILGYSRMHAGVDLGAPYGSPIYAVADGTVSWAGPHGGHGNFVRIEHGGGFGSGYAHMSRYAVAPGMRVRAGQVIGYVGSSGLSTGPHLHYEVYQNGRPVDPMAVHFTIRTGLEPREAAAFKARLAQLLLVRPGAAFSSVAAGRAAWSGKGLAPLR